MPGLLLVLAAPPELLFALLLPLPLVRLLLG